jgi:DNA repair exonuclease SbcCD nuclease subunit
MHIADIHLGYQQYGLKERFNDFSRTFLGLMDQAIEQHVDFVLLAGDLFEKRTVDPLAMRVAVGGLERLRDHGIPVLAVEGNHERPYYREQYSWVDFLDALGYLRLLTPQFEEGHAILEPHGDEGGAYVDLPAPGSQGGNIRVYGLKYYGASTGKVLNLFTEALTADDGTHDRSDVQYTILMMHAGLEDQIPHMGRLTYNDLAPLRDYVDYVALGHIHKPYEVEDWIYNPGSPETCSMDEVTWPDRGYYLVEVHPGSRPPHHATLVPASRRPFHRFHLALDALPDPYAVYDEVQILIRKQNPHVSRDTSEPARSAPVVELRLGGTMAFSRYDLDLQHIQGLLEEAWSPLTTRVQNKSVPTEFEIMVDDEVTRPELERGIIRELLERDARFRPASEAWTAGALALKRMVLEHSAPDAIIEHLRHLCAELGSAGNPGSV